MIDTGTKHRLAGAWDRLTGRTQMAAGAQFADPELFFTGVITALHGQLQERIGAEQAQHVADALRLQWAGLTQETKGKILKQWGDWTDDPVRWLRVSSISPKASWSGTPDRRASTPRPSSVKPRPRSMTKRPMPRGRPWPPSSPTMRTSGCGPS